MNRENVDCFFSRFYLIEEKVVEEEKMYKTAWAKMKATAVLTKSITLFTVTLGITIALVLLNHQNPSPIRPDPMARSFILWLHGLGDSGPANEPIKTFFTSAVFANTKWSFPSAPSNPVTCNCKSSRFALIVFSLPANLFLLRFVNFFCHYLF